MAGGPAECCSCCSTQGSDMSASIQPLPSNWLCLSGYFKYHPSCCYEGKQHFGRCFSSDVFFFVACLLACLIFSLQSAYEAITVTPRTVPHGPHWLIHFHPNIKEVELLSCGPEDLVSSPVLHVSPDPFPKPLLMTPLPAKVLIYTNKSKLEICLSYWSNSVVIKIVFV